MTDSKPKVAVVLSGCGVFDGSEIHESVLTLLALDRQGAEYECYAPDISQAQVINHISGDEMEGERNVLVESARIARGKIKNLADFDAAAVDAIMFPGGFGAAKNLSSFAFDGAECSVNEDVAAAVRAMADAGKPIAAVCIAPVIIAKIMPGAEVTIGQDADTAEAIGKMGGKHTPTSQGGVVVDGERKLVSAPCYMLQSSVSQIADGVEAAVEALLELVKERRQAV